MMLVAFDSHREPFCLSGANFCVNKNGSFINNNAVVSLSSYV